jgi:hypothetical protein
MRVVCHVRAQPSPDAVVRRGDTTTFCVRRQLDRALFACILLGSNTQAAWCGGARLAGSVSSAFLARGSLVMHPLLRRPAFDSGR